MSRTIKKQTKNESRMKKMKPESTKKTSFKKSKYFDYSEDEFE